MLVLMMPLAGIISNAAMSQRQCCRQKADMCCNEPSQACCAAETPADASLFPSQAVPQLLLPPRTVPVVYAERVNTLVTHRAGIRLPAEHSPPGLLLAAITVLRI